MTYPEGVRVRREHGKDTRIRQVWTRGWFMSMEGAFIYDVKQHETGLIDNWTSAT